MVPSSTTHGRQKLHKTLEVMILRQQHCKRNNYTLFFWEGGGEEGEEVLLDRNIPPFIHSSEENTHQYCSFAHPTYLQGAVLLDNKVTRFQVLKVKSLFVILEIQCRQSKYMKVQKVQLPQPIPNLREAISVPSQARQCKRQSHLHVGTLQSVHLVCFLVHYKGQWFWGVPINQGKKKKRPLGGSVCKCEIFRCSKVL